MAGIVEIVVRKSELILEVLKTETYCGLERIVVEILPCAGQAAAALVAGRLFETEAGATVVAGTGRMADYLVEKIWQLQSV